MCIYCLNWGLRLEGMAAATRREIEPFVWLFDGAFWHGDGHRDGDTFKTHGVFYVPDPYTSR